MEEETNLIHGMFQFLTFYYSQNHLVQYYLVATSCRTNISEKSTWKNRMWKCCGEGKKLVPWANKFESFPFKQHCDGYAEL